MLSLVELVFVPPIAVFSTSVAAVESTRNEVNVIKLLSFAALSVTVIAQSEYVPSLNELKVMVLSPGSADFELEEHGPLYEIDPDSVDEKV